MNSSPDGNVGTAGGTRYYFNTLQSVWSASSSRILSVLSTTSFLGVPLVNIIGSPIISLMSCQRLHSNHTGKRITPGSVTRETNPSLSGTLIRFPFLLVKKALPLDVRPPSGNMMRFPSDLRMFLAVIRLFRSPFFPLLSTGMSLGRRNQQNHLL